MGLKRGEPGFWDEQIRKGPGGRKKKIKSAEHLWELACKYFKEIDETPFQEQQVVKGGFLAGTKFHVDKKRPYTWSGLDVWLFTNDIISDLDAYRTNVGGAYGEYQGTLKKIGGIMRSQKFEGAASGFFNPSIIATDLGMVKKIQQVTKELPASEEELEAELEKLRSEIIKEELGEDSLL